MAYDPPETLEKVALVIPEDAVGGERGAERLKEFTATLPADEKMYYERCTICHGPREPSHYTQLQWKALTKTMFERAGLDEAERETIHGFLMKAAKDAAK
jgi:trimethylamine-N-oxide reductase (cytochrome c)